MKKCFSKVFCTSSFEKSCLAGVSLAHCFDGDLHDRTELAGRCPRTPSAEAIRAISPLHITASKRMAVLDGWLQLHIGDFVKCDNHYCRILDLVAVAPNDDVRIFASVCTVVNSTGVMWNILGVSHATMAFDPATSQDIRLALAWRELSAEKFVVLWLFQRSHPLHPLRCHPLHRHHLFCRWFSVYCAEVAILMRRLCFLLRALRVSSVRSI